VVQIQIWCNKQNHKKMILTENLDFITSAATDTDDLKVLVNFGRINFISIEPAGTLIGDETVTIQVQDKNGVHQLMDKVCVSTLSHMYFSQKNTYGMMIPVGNIALNEKRNMTVTIGIPTGTNETKWSIARVVDSTKFGGGQYFKTHVVDVNDEVQDRDFDSIYLIGTKAAPTTFVAAATVQVDFVNGASAIILGSDTLALQSWISKRVSSYSGLIVGQSDVNKVKRVRITNGAMDLMYVINESFTGSVTETLHEDIDEYISAKRLQGRSFPEHARAESMATALKTSAGVNLASIRPII
jgi:hypothetical protein